MRKIIDFRISQPWDPDGRTASSNTESESVPHVGSIGRTVSSFMKQLRFLHNPSQGARHRLRFPPRTRARAMEDGGGRRWQDEAEPDLRPRMVKQMYVDRLPISLPFPPLSDLCFGPFGCRRGCSTGCWGV